MQRRRRLRREDPRSASLRRHSSSDGLYSRCFGAKADIESLGSTTRLALDALIHLREIRRLDSASSTDDAHQAEVWPTLLGLA